MGMGENLPGQHVENSMRGRVSLTSLAMPPSYLTDQAKGNI